MTQKERISLAMHELTAKIYMLLGRFPDSNLDRPIVLVSPKVFEVMQTMPNYYPLNDQIGLFASASYVIPRKEFKLAGPDIYVFIPGSHTVIEYVFDTDVDETDPHSLRIPDVNIVISDELQPPTIAHRTFENWESERNV